MGKRKRRIKRSAEHVLGQIEHMLDSTDDDAQQAADEKQRDVVRFLQAIRESRVARRRLDHQALGRVKRSMVLWRADIDKTLASLPSLSELTADQRNRSASLRVWTTRGRILRRSIQEILEEIQLYEQQEAADGQG